MKKKVLLIGAGRHGSVIAENIFDIPGIRLYGFVDKKNTSLPQFIIDKGYKILGDDEILPKIEKDIFIHICLGGELLYNRKKLIEKIDSLKLQVITITHPSSYIAKSSTIGKGVTILVGSLINSNAKLGDYCCINTGAIVEHDCVIGENVFIQPNSVLGGNVLVDDNSVIGIGASIRDNISIGKNCLIGGGAFVCKDIPDNSVAYGVPAKVIASRDVIC